MEEPRSRRTPQPTTVGLYLTRHRAKRRLTVAEIARRSNVPESTVNRIETGFIRVPSADILRRLAETLGLPAFDLLSLAGHTDERDLPALEPYLRSKYGNRLTDQARAEFDAVARKHGLDPKDSKPQPSP